MPLFDRGFVDLTWLLAILSEPAALVGTVIAKRADAPARQRPERRI